MVNTHTPALHHHVTDHKKQRNSSLRSQKMVTLCWFVKILLNSVCTLQRAQRQKTETEQDKKTPSILGTSMFLHDFVADYL